MSRFFCFVICLLFFSIDSYATSYKYVIISGKDTTGFLEVSKRVANDSVYYEYKSDASVTFFKRFHVIATKETCYYNDKMICSETRNTVNGDIRDYARLDWYKDKYVVNQKREEETIQADPVYFSTIRMFFEEPKNLNAVYSESKTKDNDLVFKENDIYEIDSGFAQSSTFFYQEGKLVKVRVNIPIIKFELLLIEG